MKPKRNTVSLLPLRWEAFVWLLLVAFPAAAQTPPPSDPATELVRQTVAHELAAVNADGHYMYRFRQETPQGSETRDMIETRDWLISRLIRKNGQPLPPAQRQREDERLRGLLTNRARLMKLQGEKGDDEARVRRIIKALPETFLFQSAGTQKDSSGRELARVTFRPNPAFRPRSSELRVLQGMEGTMLIDPVAVRLVRIEAKLFQDVDFGWGMLAHIYRGGTFLLEQHGVGHDRWAITTLVLHYTNRIMLLFKSRVDSVRQASDFRRMRDDLTLQEGLELLLNQDQMPAAEQKPEIGQSQTNE